MDKPLHVQVAEALGWTEIVLEDGYRWVGRAPVGFGNWGELQPFGVIARYDTNWAATGPLVEKYKLNLVWNSASEAWEAIDRSNGWDDCYHGDTALVAACYLLLALKAAGKLNT